MSTKYQHLVIENRNNGLRVILFNNIKKKNAWNPQTYLDITNVLNESAIDDSVTCIALSGIGDFYSSGNDMIAAMEYRLKNNKPNDVVNNMVKAFYNFPKLLFAVINGPCIGIAATTAALCDVIYISDTAYIYTPFTLLGLCAEACASYTFARIVGKTKASEMLLLNHKMYADEALRFNFASEIFTKSELSTKIWPRIEGYAKLPKESLKVTKKLMKQFEINDLEKAWNDEFRELQKRIESEEAANAVFEFMNRKNKL